MPWIWSAMCPYPGHIFVYPRSDHGPDTDQECGQYHPGLSWAVSGLFLVPYRAKNWRCIWYDPVPADVGQYLVQNWADP